MIAPYAPEKRSALICAAAKLLREQGLARTTLAHVAQESGVPLGNLYYYFKTKDELAVAVIAAHAAELRAHLAAWEAGYRDPRRCLHAFIRAPLAGADSIVQFGCPHGSLCQELAKLPPDAPLAQASSQLFAVYLDWVGSQFRALGYSKRSAQALAADLVAAVQGTMLLAHSMRSAALLARQIRRIERWLNATVTPRTAAHRG